MQACEADAVETRDPAGLQALWPAALLLVAGLVGLVAAMLAPTGAGDQYAVIAPPWSTLSQTIRAIRSAQGDVVQISRPVFSGTIVIAHARRPDFVAAAYGAGAWLVIDPQRLRGCAGLTPIGRERRA